MFNVIKPAKSTIKVNTSYKGETIEKKIARIMTNKEPIKDGAQLIFSDRKEGVKPEYNIRTDRFDVAVEAMDKVNKSKKAKREGKQTLGDQAKEGMDKENGGKASPIQGTNE